MQSPSKNRFPGQLIFNVVAVAFSFGILYFSIFKTSLDTMAKNNNDNKLRIEPIEFVMNKKNGEQEKCTYSLPEVKTLPNSPIYKVKELRDFMWILLSHEPLDKAKITLLVADKKMNESLNLCKEKNYNLILDTSEEAINKLKYAEEITSNINKESTDSKKLKEEINKAGLAYKEALIKMNTDKKIDQNKYNEIVTDLDKWNEENKER
ncbi:MAG: DUF5667 domain-containing protein [Candidatus Shapirobacteria bacterium]